MELIVKRFDELTTRELFEIYKLRVNVFVVEQQSPYQEVDDADQAAYHMWYRDESGIAAYLRVLPPGTTFENVSIGRVIAAQRSAGLGAAIMREGIALARSVFRAESITIEAQTQARGFYEKLGFVQISEEFLDAGVPHIKMLWTYKNKSKEAAK